MKLIKPCFEIIDFNGNTLDDIEKHIELCGRVCYKSEDRITKTSAKPFVSRCIDSGHLSVLEHAPVYLKLNMNNRDEYIKHIEYLYNEYSVVTFDDNRSTAYVTTNYRVIVENNWTDDLKYLVYPTKYHSLRITVKYTTNIHVYKDLTRHRKMSYSIESTRLCNYNKDKFDKQLTFIHPCWCKEDYTPGIPQQEEEFNVLLECFEAIESAYNHLINLGWKAEQAANVLPQATKADVIESGFVKDWIHVFKLRYFGVTGAPHPQVKEVMDGIYNKFVNRNYIKPLN